MAIRTAAVIMPGNENAFDTGARGALTKLADLEDKYRTLLEGPVTCTLATMMSNGRPQLTPIWVAHDGTHVLVNTKKGRVKDTNMRDRPQVSIMAVNPENPYHWITINGRVVDMIEETDSQRGHEATDNVNTLSKRYLDEDPYPLRDPKGEVRVLFKVLPEYIMTFGAPQG